MNATSRRLSNATLRDLKPAVARPAYDRAAVTPGIVHLGVGAFHRAHQAVTIDDCLGAGELDWGIVGASLRSPETRDALGPQDGLYTVARLSDADRSLRVVGSVLSVVVAPYSPSALLRVMADPRIRIVTLTITEKAYLRDAAGDLDRSHPDIAHDLAHPAEPKTAHGFIVEALRMRRAAGVPPFTVVSCDNLPANGHTLRRLVLQFAEAGDGGLARHIADSVGFPSTMVDRIVPATTDADRARIAAELGVEDRWPVMAEPFTQWVVEDDFRNGRPRWERFGVTMVSDVAPYEAMKLRLLNGAHSAIAYIGLLSGKATVAEAFAEPAIRGAVERVWAASIPTLPAAGLDPQLYIERLTERFANRAIAHRTAQIAMDGSQKLPQRILASAELRAADETSAKALMLVVAAWIAACEARGQTGIVFTDPLDARLEAIFAKRQTAGETVRAVFDAAGYLGGSAAREPLMQITSDHLEHLRSGGLAA